MEEIVEKLEERLDKLTENIEIACKNMQGRITELERALEGIYIQNRKLVEKEKEYQKRK